MTPEMPKDWWPDRVVVRANQDVGDRMLTCQFMLMPEDARVEAAWKIKLEELRLAMWRAIHSEETV